MDDFRSNCYDYWSCMTEDSCPCRVLSTVFERWKLLPQKILLSLWYIGNYWKKSSRCNKVIAHTVTFLKIVSQNASDCISEHIHCKTFPGERGGGGCHQTLLGSWYAFSHSGLLPQMINPR